MSDSPTKPPLSASQQWELVHKVKSPDIKTKAERDDLISQREAPKLERHYTPTGMVEKEVHTAEAQKREARIKSINAALQKASSGLNKDFDRSR